MNFALMYVIGAIIVGILQMIDGTLIILNKGYINSFNVFTALIELTWFLFSIFFTMVFHKLNLSKLSPLSFVIYIAAGWTTASLITPSQDTEVAIVQTVPIEFAIVGVLFGLFYLLVNEHIKNLLAERRQK